MISIIFKLHINFKVPMCTSIILYIIIATCEIDFSQKFVQFIKLLSD